MKPEHKKLVFGLALLVIAAGVSWKLWPADPAKARNVPYVCVATGEVFRLSGNDIPTFLPGRNPKTNTDTLIPAKQAEDGSIVVNRHYRELLRDPELARQNRYVDPKTLELLKEPRTP